MSLTLTVDGERWRAHLREVAAANPGLVPVAKGNGYGFTLGRLARRAQWLDEQRLHDTGVDTLAIGTYDELPHVAQRFAGSLLVLTPWRPFGAALGVPEALADRVVHTVGRAEDLEELRRRRPDAPFVLERVTSMLRHGLSARELWSLAPVLRAHPRARLEGIAMHLPLAHGSHLSAVDRLMNAVGAAGLDTRTIWLSHLT